MAFTGEIGHLSDVQSPWGNAGGVVKTIEDVEKMAHTGVGWIEAGSYTLEPRLGNAWNPETSQFDKTVYYHDPVQGETYNSLGMPNKGMDLVEQEIPEMVRIAHSLGKWLVVNVAPVSHDPEDEARELVKRAYSAGADAVLLNAGCPNVVTSDGDRHEILSHNANALRTVLFGLTGAVHQYKPLFLRVSPFVNYGKASWIYDSLPDGLVSAVFTPNTWGGNKPVNDEGAPILDVPGGFGGLSGPATADRAQAQTNHATQLLRTKSIDVVRSGGITNAAELERCLASGAVAGAGTTFFYESKRGWTGDVDRMMSELAT